MLADLDEYSIANQVSLLRDTYRGTVFLVEGPDDGRLMDKFKAREDRCRVIPAFGKEKALRALAILRERGLGQRLLVLLDADYWRLTGHLPTDTDIVVTDFHDLEMDIAMSDALEDVLREFGDAEAIASFERTRRCSVREALLNELRRVSAIRFANARHNLFLRFRDVDLADFIDEGSVVVDTDAYLLAVLDTSHREVSLADILESENEVSLGPEAVPHAVRGHDFSAALAVALRRAIGQCSPELASPTQVEALLRLAFGREHLERTALHSSILAWEDRTGAPVLN